MMIDVDPLDVFHAASALVAVPAEVAFSYVADGLRQSQWALGSWEREEVGEGLFRGRSLFDDSLTYVRIDARTDLLLVDYLVGPAPDRLLRVNSARVVPGALIGRDADRCVVTLMKWRTGTQTDDDWRQAVTTFDLEIMIIRRRLEAGVA
jgi:hypothetical protein